MSISTTTDAGEHKPPFLQRWLFSTNHKDIGTLYLLFSMMAGILGTGLSVLMRMELQEPGLQIFGDPSVYNVVMTSHGLVMIFYVIMPALIGGFGNWMVPIMIGAPDMAFPRMNNISFWLLLVSFVLFIISLFVPGAPGVNGHGGGWTMYPPFAESGQPGPAVDLVILAIHLSGASSILGAINFITTIFNMRAPGMSMHKMPLFAWSMLVTAFMLLMALPVLAGAITMVLTDRNFGTTFFVPEGGGDPILYQHLFWFFGHPEVYLIFIPPLGFMSSIIATFSRRPVVGYPAMVLALIGTAFLAFGLWVHHMFATNLPELGQTFFTAASLMIAIPTAVQIFCWIATLWTGRLNLKTPLLFVLAFFVILLAGGLTGLMLASVSLDYQLHDTFFVVAHLHYVLLGGAVFPLFGAFYFWFPKFTGRMLSERLGRWNFWLFFIGFNVAFFPMHVLGLQGMTRRIYTYPEEMGWGNLNLLATVGALTIAVSVLLFIINVLHSRRHGELASSDPWGGGTLEWSVASPPPMANFPLVPVVHGRYPLWQARAVQIPK